MQAAAAYFSSYRPSVQHPAFLPFRDKAYLLTASLSPDERWKVVYLISSEDVLSDAANIRFNIYAICLISVIAALCIALYISNNLTSNITRLLHTMRAVEQGDFSKRLAPTTRDEVGQLLQGFNRMSQRLEGLIRDIAFEQVEKQKAEYKALQAQMNPHFLYNALESMNSYAKIRRQPEIAELIQSLSYLLRMSISRNATVALREELLYVRHYLALQKTILGDRIHVAYNVDEQLLCCEVPKLILQPIVENAIVHGIESMRADGLIFISVRAQGHNLVIHVSDNGKGFEAAVLQSLFDEQTSPADSRHTHLGMQSVDRRIKLRYGPGYGVTITSAPQEGAVVELVLPIQTNTFATQANMLAMQVH